MKSEKQKMLNGDGYDPNDAELTAMRLRARELCHRFNLSDPSALHDRGRIMRELFAEMGDGVWVEPPFRCDYGSNVILGEKVYFNFDCVILDVCPVRIGSHVFFGPGVHLYAATHPIDALARRESEFGKPVTIGDDVWIGGRTVVCPGVTIGSGSVIGAGTVVTKDVPAGVVAAGNPARVLRQVATGNKIKP